MDIKMEILSMDRALLGLCYNRGSGTLKNGKEVIFHEIGIGLFILQIHFTFY